MINIMSLLIIFHHCQTGNGSTYTYASITYPFPTLKRELGLTSGFPYLTLLLQKNFFCFLRTGSVCNVVPMGATVFFISIPWPR